MKEDKFKEKWISEKPIYKAWGEFILETITNELKNRGKNLEVFLKVPPICRLKQDDSLIDKAFYRPDKNYSDPYKEIEDKIGIRFVVLLLEDIKEIENILKESDYWEFDPCKHFEIDKKNEPLLFTYQSVHFILRPKNSLSFAGVVIPPATPCEVQVRTLLQHAHAELTHDAIYKAKKAVKPEVHRTVAKSMALIETTDTFFGEVVEYLNHGPVKEYEILERLNGMYELFVDIKPCTHKSSLYLWEEFEQLASIELPEDIQKFLDKYPSLKDVIRSRYSSNILYQQSVILFLYWMLKNKRKRLLKDWPFQRTLLEQMAGDLGISIRD